MAISGKAIITAFRADGSIVGDVIEREYSVETPAEIEAFFADIKTEYDAKAADATDEIERFGLVGA